MIPDLCSPRPFNDVTTASWRVYNNSIGTTPLGAPTCKGRIFLTIDSPWSKDTLAKMFSGNNNPIIQNSRIQQKQFDTYYEVSDSSSSDEENEIFPDGPLEASLREKKEPDPTPPNTPTIAASYPDIPPGITPQNIPDIDDAFKEGSLRDPRGVSLRDSGADSLPTTPTQPNVDYNMRDIKPPQYLKFQKVWDSLKDIDPKARGIKTKLRKLHKDLFYNKNTKNLDHTQIRENLSFYFKS